MYQIEWEKLVWLLLPDWFFFFSVSLCSAGGIVHNSLRPEVPSWCDPEWKALMESCWDSEPGERPSFSEISQKLRKMSATINVKWFIPLNHLILFSCHVYERDCAKIGEKCIEVQCLGQITILGNTQAGNCKILRCDHKVNLYNTTRNVTFLARFLWFYAA